MRRNRPRNEWANTTTKYSCFIGSPARLPFGFGAKYFPRGPGGAISYKLPFGEFQTVTGSTGGCQPLSTRCKLLITLVLLPLTVTRRLPGTLFLQNLVERRSLLFQLVRRDFEQRFVGSAVGWIWGLIHPLVLLLSWVFVFQVCLGMPAPAGEEKYSLYIFAGMLPWLLFSETVQRVFRSEEHTSELQSRQYLVCR